MRARNGGTAGRGRRLMAAFPGMLAMALDDGGAEEEWLLFLEDDLEFHPRIGSLVEAWAALEDRQSVCKSQFARVKLKKGELYSVKDHHDLAQT